MLKTADFVLPSFYAPVLINADPEGLTEEENTDIDKFISKNNLGLCLGMEDLGFKWKNDLNAMGSDCGLFTFEVLK